jgi:hypothetical protein
MLVILSAGQGLVNYSQDLASKKVSRRGEMQNLVMLLIMLSLGSCADVGNRQEPQEPLNPVTLAVPQKSPHGYVVGGDPERFGGFIGDCASDENFPYYWKCQAENSGNDFK